MKRIAFYLALLPLIFSCEPNVWDDTVIINESPHVVTFKFRNMSEITLRPHGELGYYATFPTVAFQHLEWHDNEKRVFFSFLATNDGYTGWFRELDHWKIKIYNQSGMGGKLAAYGWMDEITFDDSTDIQTDIGWLIFTNKPQFAAVVSVSFSCDDCALDTCKVNHPVFPTQLFYEFVEECYIQDCDVEDCTFFRVTIR